MSADRPWNAKAEPSVAQAAAAIARRFPSLRTSHVRLLGRGWDNTAFLTEDDIVFRFPRRAAAATQLETEAAVLPRLAGRLPVAVPDPQWRAEPGDDFPWPFLGYRRLPGRSADGARLDAAARTANAPALARLLASLHAIEPPASVPGDVLGRTDFAARLPLMVERLETLRVHAIVPTARPWLALFDELGGVVPPGRATLVHGDLYARHLLVDEHDRLSGVIDWGDVHAGAASMDLMPVYAFLPASARATFLAEYGTPDDDVLRTARLRAAFHAVSLTWYGVELNDADLMDEGRAALGFVLED